ncbi:hypothetical protein EON63_00630 [archaeon]|nr:MAG: hypothetical protein EON63_00630 [archaeon]
MEQKIPCLRDGRAEQLNTRLLVPGDVILLMGGAQVPADVEWVEVSCVCVWYVCLVYVVCMCV